MRVTGLEQAMAALAQAPDRFEEVLRLVPANRWACEPDGWDGVPGERFSAVGQACHLRDIETDGYHVRFRRLLEEDGPELVSLDGYELERERRYQDADPFRAVSDFRSARRKTTDLLARIPEDQLERRGRFAEYGDITLRALVHYLRSHDQQHLACLHWLLGRMASLPR